MIREGNGEPIVLLHGVTSTESAWRDVIPHLAKTNEVIAFTALGHRGGNKAKPGDEIPEIIDDAEKRLDGLNLDRPHIAGNSMGGWVALELARRGRASTVCALSPAGCWNLLKNERKLAQSKFQRMVRISKVTRHIMPLLAKFPAIRKAGMNEVARHGDRLTPSQFLQGVDDMLGCEVRENVLKTRHQLQPLDPVPCPIMLAWSEMDRLFPVKINGEIARSRVPGASWCVLSGVGHVPMVDDPLLTARTIIESTKHRKTTIKE